MDIVALLLGVTLASWTVASLRSRSVNALPGVLHNAAWSFGLLVVGTGLLNYDSPSTYAWFVIAGAIFAFNLGLLLSRGNEAVDQPLEGSRAELVTLRQFVGLLVLFGAGVLIYLASIARSFGLAVLISDPTSIRRYSDVGYLEAFPIYGKLLFYLGPLCFILAVFPRFVRGLEPSIIQKSLAAAIAASQLVTLQRTNLFVCIVWACGVVVLASHSGLGANRFRITARGAIAATLAATVGLLAFQGLAVALDKTGETNDSINLVVDERLKGSPYTAILHYASSGIPAFGRLVESDNHNPIPRTGGRPIYGDYNPQTWGAASFSGPLKLVPGAPTAAEVSPFVLLPVPTNVYTWLEPWYRDFRAPGVLAFAAAMGILIGHASRVRRRSPEAILLASLLVGLSALSTFSNRYLTVTSIVLYASLWWLGRVRRKREQRIVPADRGRRPSGERQQVARLVP